MHIPRSRLITVILILVLIFSIIRLLYILPQRCNKDDFSHYYIATRIFLSGDTPYGVNLVPLYADYGFKSKGKQTLTTDYPPLFFDLFSPFASLNPRSGFMLWFGLEILCLFYILLLSGSLLKTDFSVNGWLLFCILIILSNWVYYQFYFSQVTLILAVLVLSAFALNKKEKHDAACVLVTIAGLIKFFPFIFLPWFIWRKKKFEILPIRQIITVALSIAAIIAMSGLDHWINYFTLDPKLGMIANSYLRLLNYSLPSFIVNMIYAVHTLQLNSISWKILVLIGTFFGLLLIGWGYLSCIRTSSDRELEFSLLSVVMLLGFPRSFNYCLVFLIFPIAVAFVRTLRSESKKSLLFLIMIYLFTDLYHLEFVFLFLGFRPSLPVLILLTYIPFYGLMGLMLFFYKSMQSKNNYRIGSLSLQEN